jgi:hypothetical protein
MEEKKHEKEFEDCPRGMPPHLRGPHHKQMHKMHGYKEHPPHLEILKRLNHIEEMLKRIDERV